MSSASTSRIGDDVVGQQIGPYEVLGRLATGGMAELLLAKRTGIEGFQKIVALKRILPHFASNPDFVAMFLHEARLAATLEHPNIAAVFDIGKSGDDYYFAMAYVHGRDVLAILRELSRLGRELPIAHAIAIASGIAAGLHHAHEQVGFDGQPLAIVHRDVSPANAIVAFDGGVKLVDFGIAKAAASSNDTRIGVRKGKAAYMSPEQCRGEQLDRRTDVWSLGVVLYEMLTMARLFRAESDLAIMHRIVSVDVAPPSTVNPAIGPELDAIVLRSLRRDRAARYPTAAAMLADLEQCARRLPQIATGAILGAFVRALFGPVPPPWAGGDAAGRVATAELDGGFVDPTTPLGAATPNAGAAAPTIVLGPPSQPSARGLGPTAPLPTVALPANHALDVVAPPADASSLPTRSPSPMLAIGAVVAIAALAAGAYLAWPRRPIAPAPAAAVAVPSLPSSTPPPQQPVAVAPSPPSAAELEGFLAAVHQTDPARALGWNARHELLRRLAATSAGGRIDADVQLELDLIQARDAPTPCNAFDDALRRAEDRPERFAAALTRAVAPDPLRDVHAGRPPDGTCDGLAARLEALRAHATPPVAPPSASKPKRPRPRGASTSRSPSAPAPGDAGTGRIDDELRPFRK